MTTSNTSIVEGRSKRPDATTLRTLAMLLPVAFGIHVIEEAPGFVQWFNSLVSPGISQRLFLRVNATAFAVTLVLGGLVAVSRQAAIAALAVAWVGFLLLANGVFHLVGTLVHWRYSPGVVTGTLIYLPLSFLFMRAVVRECGMSWPTIAGVAIAGGIPMYIHGYMIVFLGRRFF